MTEKQSPLEIASTAEQTTTESPRTDGPTVNPRQKLEAANSTPERLAFDSSEFSRIELSPELKEAISYGRLARLELEGVEQTPANRAFTPAARAAILARDSSGAAAPPNGPLSLPDAAPEADPAPMIAKPKAWPGVLIACLLGALPIIALVLVRWQGNGAEDSATPTEVIETRAAPTQIIDVSAPASTVPKPASTAAEPEVVDAPLEPRVAPAAAAQVARLKLSSPPISRPSPAPSSPAPVRSSWFHR